MADGLLGSEKKLDKSSVKWYVGLGGTLVILLGLFFVIYGSIDYETEITQEKIDNRVGVVIDAGGSGTRLIIYSYTNHSMKQLKYEECEDQGLTNYNGSELDELRRLLKACLNDAVISLRNMTNVAHKKVPIYFAATAGMRLLRLRNKEEYDQIWKLVNECLEKSDFKIAKVGTITGFEEAEWAWVAANYLKHTFDSDQAKYGTLDFGSSSVQVAFVPKDNSKSSPDVKTIDIDGHRINLYAHSYLCYGSREMSRRFLARLVKLKNYGEIVENPCYFAGYSENFTSEYLWQEPCSSGDYAKNYLGEEMKGPANRRYAIKGTGSFDQCSQLLNDQLDKQCNHSGLCGINGEYQPSINGHFFAMSAFYYIGKSMNLTTDSGPEVYLQRARSLCVNSWEDMIRGLKYTKYVDEKCFMAAYGYYLLAKGFKFNENTWDIEYKKEIDGTNVGWSLGLMYANKEAMYTTDVQYLRSFVKKPVLLILIVLGPICIVVGLVLLLTLKFCKANRKDEPEAESLREGFDNT